MDIRAQRHFFWQVEKMGERVNSVECLHPGFLDWGVWFLRVGIWMEDSRYAEGIVTPWGPLAWWVRLLHRVGGPGSGDEGG